MLPLRDFRWLVMLGLVATAGINTVVGRTLAEEGADHPRWLAGTLLRYEQELALTPDQRARLQLVEQRAEAAWQEWSRRLAALGTEHSLAAREDWTALAHERGRLRVLADRDALVVLRPEQRARWQTLQSAIQSSH